MADFVSSLTGVQMDNALMDMAEHNSEAFAVGERNGVPVVEGDVTYHNNSKYWASFAADAAEGASIITDPNEDGNLVIDSPSGSESGWAVRYDAAQDLSDAQKAQARKNIAAGGSNPNLLDNPWFTVNQRGFTSGSFATATYWADRWLMNTNSTGNGSLSLSSGVVSLTVPSGSSKFGNIYQRLEDPSIIDGKTVTLSALKADGTIISGSTVRTNGTVQTVYSQDGITLQFAAGNAIVLQGSDGASISIKAMKLELGTVSTLAADAPPDYGTELAKCKAYFERIGTSWGTYAIFGTGVATSETNAYISVPMTPKRATSFTVVSNGSFRLLSNVNYAVTNISRPNHQPTTSAILTITSSGLTAGAAYMLQANNDGTCYIDVSADL